MQKSTKMTAEKQFTATRKKDEQFLSAKDKAVQERSDKRARLKALRLENEASNLKA